jgi:hypothetical protein
MAPATQAPQKQNHRPLSIELFEETHPFYTCGDLVRGVVRVEPALRPQRISVAFRGFSVIYDQSGNGTTPKLFHYNQDLFVSSGVHESFEILRRGTANDGKVELPFEFTFPHTVCLAPPTNRSWKYSKDSFDHPRFQHSPGFLLPPSCTAMASARGPIAPKITYILEAHLDSVNHFESPRIQVRQELKFLPPAPEYDVALLHPNFDLAMNLPSLGK